MGLRPYLDPTRKRFLPSKREQPTTAKIRATKTLRKLTTGCTSRYYTKLSMIMISALILGQSVNFEGKSLLQKPKMPGNGIMVGHTPGIPTSKTESRVYRYKTHVATCAAYMPAAAAPTPNRLARSRPRGHSQRCSPLRDYWLLPARNNSITQCSRHQRTGHFLSKKNNEYVP